MQIFVRSFNGKIITLDVESSDKIKNLKVKLKEKEGTPLEQQRLKLGPKYLMDSHSLSDYNIQNESTIELELIPSEEKTLADWLYNNHNELEEDRALAYDNIQSKSKFRYLCGCTVIRRRRRLKNEI
ncbi:ubiquitin-like [Telopea speciosissima]|uniref:ubiquitin-like n=1 Tax=Telopea speciosissima TaxID=54955 RepID=UPI001CC67E34|nr:ubiquitin-like [Telopea speciosissima]